MFGRSSKEVKVLPPQGEGAAPTSPDRERAESGAIDSRLAELHETHAEQQLRTFTRWWNSVLAPRQIIESLLSDLQSGVVPLTLYEQLSGTVVRRMNAKPKNKYQMMENQNAFIAALKEKGLKLVNIGGEDLYDTNRTLILGLTWTLILRFEIHKYGADEQELLRWIKKSTAGYKGVNITTWGKSFRDGLAFCALINKHDPKALVYDGLDPSDALANLDKAFTVAEQTFGVPRLLEPTELVGEAPTDERSVITYAVRERASGERD